MKLTTQDYLRVVSPCLPSRLISSQYVAWISRVAEVLPPSSNFGFECSLASPVPAADFLVAVIPSDGSRSAWAGENPLAGPPPETDSDSAWKSVQRFLGAWSHEAALAPIHDTWLEFDIAEPGSNLPEPSFFFGFDDRADRNHPDLVVALVERLLTRPMGERRRQKLLSCFSALPENGLIFQVGLLLARPTDEIRLCTRWLARDEILSYLQRIGWGGSIAELSLLMTELAPLVDAISLDISVEDSVSGSIGLECTIHDQPEGRKRVDSFLQYLVARNACLPAKKEAIFEWLGFSTQESDESRWPTHLLKASRSSSVEGMSTFARTLNHIKISFESEKPVSAKAYLGVRHFWARRVAGTLA